MKIDFKNDNTRAQEETEGSDGRLNVSSRADNRAYYISRDKGQCYTLPYEFNTSGTGEYAAYLKNTSTDKTMVISSVGLNSEVATRFKLEFVTGTAAAGDTVIPTNVNNSSPNDAVVSAMEGASAGTGITGLTAVNIIDYAFCTATGHEEMRLSDRVRLGQNDAIALQVSETAGGDVAGVIFFFYE